MPWGHLSPSHQLLQWFRYGDQHVVDIILWYVILQKKIFKKWKNIVKLLAQDVDERIFSSFDCWVGCLFLSSEPPGALLKYIDELRIQHG